MCKTVQNNLLKLIKGISHDPLISLQGKPITEMYEHMYQNAYERNKHFGTYVHLIAALSITAKSTNKSSVH